MIKIHMFHVKQERGINELPKYNRLFKQFFKKETN